MSDGQNKVPQNFAFLFAKIIKTVNWAELHLYLFRAAPSQCINFKTLTFLLKQIEAYIPPVIQLVLNISTCCSRSYSSDQ